MNTLHLHIDQMIKDEFRPKKLNLLLTFQVNCPGCFMYALPMFNQLHTKFSDQLGFIALSTAFEDYELNTLQNTELLVSEGLLVGETKKAFGQRGETQLPYPLQFPIGMDKKLPQGEKTELVENICQLNPNFPIWTEYDQDVLRKRVLDYLDQQDEISLTFTANQFRGTPSIALFNEQNELLASWFGHVPLEGIIEKIASFN